MTATILSFLTTTLAGKAVLGTGSTAIALWLIGLFPNSSLYRWARTASGKLVYSAFRALSILGETRLGKLWQPLENILEDFILLWGSQAGAGLRSDNPGKIADEVERLMDVGSVTRADALKRKLEVLRHIPNPLRDAQDAAMMNRLHSQGSDSIAGKLGDH